jgi:hypothetical protein
VIRVALRPQRTTTGRSSCRSLAISPVIRGPRTMELAAVRRRVASDERGRLMQGVAAAGEPIALIGALEICAR